MALPYFFHGLQALELAQGALVGALEGVDAALEPVEGGGAAGVGSAFGSVLVVLEGRGELVFPNLSVDFGETAEVPVVTDESVDIVALLGGGGVEPLDVFLRERFESRAIFAADEERLRVDAGFQGILGRVELALDGARAGGFLCIETIGLDLFDGRHDFQLAWGAAELPEDFTGSY